MAHFRGKIAVGEQVVTVEGDLFMRTSPGGITSWDGAFGLRQGQFIGPGAYRLELEDGRSGEIIVTNANYSSGYNPRITFHGSGPLQ